MTHRSSVTCSSDEPPRQPEFEMQLFRPELPAFESPLLARVAVSWPWRPIAGPPHFRWITDPVLPGTLAQAPPAQVVVGKEATALAKPSFCRRGVQPAKRIRVTRHFENIMRVVLDDSSPAAPYIPRPSHALYTAHLYLLTSFTDPP